MTGSVPLSRRCHFDLEMATDIARSAASDHIDDTLNYKAVAKRVIAFVEDSRFLLVETLAERVAELIMRGVFGAVGTARP